MHPKLSVIMPVYNQAIHVREAIESMLAQTFTDFELIIINDLSTDDSLATINSFTDSRIRVHTNARNMGRAGSDNEAIPFIRGEYVAKMDDDDICRPDRFLRQVAFLDEHPEINTVGGSMQNFAGSTYLNEYPEDPEDAKCLTLFGIPVGNGTAMFRSSLFLKDGLRYREELRQTEDYDFYARYVNKLRIASIKTPLCDYRVNESVARKDVLALRLQAANEVRGALLAAWGIQYTAEELNVHNAIAATNLALYGVSLQQCNTWLHKLLRYNESVPWFNATALQRLLATRWFYCCYFNPSAAFGSWLRYYRTSPDLRGRRPAKEHFKFLLRSIQQMFR